MRLGKLSILARQSQRSFIQLARNWRSSVLGILFLFFLLSSYSIMYFHSNITRIYRAQLEAKYPAEILLLTKVDGEQYNSCISDNFINEVMRVPHVQSFNRTNVCEAKLIEKANPGMPDKSLSINTFIDITTPLNPYFRTGQLELMIGQFPSPELNGALVNADYFGISSDSSDLDSVQLEIERNGTRYSLDIPIVGAYQSIYPIETVINGVTVKQNVIFLNESSVLEHFSLPLERGNVKFFLDDHSALEETMSKLNQLDYDHEKYCFSPSLSPDLEQLLKSLRIGEVSRKMIMMIYLLISTGMLFVYLIHDYLKNQKNMRIYSLLGEKRSHIICGYCLSLLMRFVLACCLAFPLTLLLQNFISKTVLFDLTKTFIKGAMIFDYELQRSLLLHDYRLTLSARALIIPGLYVLGLVIVFLSIIAKHTYKRLNCGKFIGV